MTLTASKNPIDNAKAIRCLFLFNLNTFQFIFWIDIIFKCYYFKHDIKY
ncbi:hypothetical protein ASZ90_013866 [hydrocarbon metagenome]|uniref:Uncharacterized protein n=1 Tax=hydrocarbon metagenome TaxID=938273 RepID=A0A0W8F6F5_9ZZZZ